MAKKKPTPLERMSDAELKAEISRVEAQFTPNKEELTPKKQDTAVALHKRLSAELARRKAEKKKKPKKPKIKRLKDKFARFFRRRL
jgi:hypothetical protein